MSGTSRKKSKKGSVKRKKKLKLDRIQIIIAACTAFIAIASLIVAIASFYFAYNQTKETRKQTEEMCKYYRLSTIPLIQNFVDKTWRKNKDNGCHIVNNGPGPAIIDNVTLCFNGKTYDLTDSKNAKKVGFAIAHLILPNYVFIESKQSSDDLKSDFMSSIQPLLPKQNLSPEEQKALSDMFADEPASEIKINVFALNKGYFLRSGEDYPLIIINFKTKKGVDSLFKTFKNILDQMKIEIEYSSIYGEHFFHKYSMK